MRQHTLNLNALDNTVISSYSAAIADVAYGHAKRDPELLVFNFTFACDQDSGNIVFAMPLKAQLLMSRPYPVELLAVSRKNVKNEHQQVGQFVVRLDRSIYRSLDILR